jgi:hypothetical protein
MTPAVSKLGPRKPDALAQIAGLLSSTVEPDGAT